MHWPFLHFCEKNLVSYLRDRWVILSTVSYLQLMNSFQKFLFWENLYRPEPYILFQLHRQIYGFTAINWWYIAHLTFWSPRKQGFKEDNQKFIPTNHPTATHRNVHRTFQYGPYPHLNYFNVIQIRWKHSLLGNFSFYICSKTIGFKKVLLALY